MSLCKKRKIDEENRQFQEKWENMYFVVMSGGKVTCLVCQNAIAVPKEYNVRRHYETNHKTLAAIQGVLRAEKVEQLKSSLGKQQSFFTKSKSESESAVQASFAISRLIALHSKPFSDGEVIKECITTAVEIICPEKLQQFKNISLSRNTVAERISEIGSSLSAQLKDKCASFKSFSLALDETNDVGDVAQLAVFVRGVNDDMSVTEELLDVMPMHGKTGSAEIFGQVKEVAEKYALPLERMSAFVSDGAPAMVGSKTGVAARFQEYVSELHPSVEPFQKLHCIVHQEALCTKVIRMDHVMNVVAKIVNFIKARGLNHRQFRSFLDDLGVEHQELLYYNNVRWLSRGCTLQRFHELLEPIKEFLREKDCYFDELDDPRWLADLAFFVDLTAHLNKLNTDLQGKGRNAGEMYDSVKSFCMKLRLFQNQIVRGNFAHFPSVAKVAASEEVCDDYKHTIVNLRDEFESRFHDFKQLEPRLQLFRCPFTIDASKVEECMQLELIDLQCDADMKTKFYSVGVKNFYRYLPVQKYPAIHKNAIEMLSLFGSTYVCEQYFSRMSHIKSHTRSRLTQVHLTAASRIATTSLEVDIKEVARAKRPIVSTISKQ